MYGREMILSASLIISGLALSRPALAEEKQAARLELAVIVSDEVQLTEISLQDLQRIFTENKVALVDGLTMIPINLPPRSSERTLFDRVVLRMDPDAVARYWIDQKIRGVVMPPKFVPSSALAARLAQKVKSAIAYVPSGRVPPGTHALTVEGRRPGQPGYLLVDPP